MSVPPPLPNIAGGQQQVIYHVYQMGAPEAGITFNTKSVNVKAWLRPLLLFGLFSVWVVYLAGVSYDQANCNGNNLLNNPWLFPYAIPANPTAADCVQYFGLFWWSLWLQFIAVVAAIVIFVFPCLKTYSLTTMYFFLMSSVLLFFQANQSFTIVYTQYYKGIGPTGSISWNWWNGAALTAAGAIGSLIVNFIYITWYSHLGAVPPPVEAAVDEPAVDVKVTA